MEIYKTGIGNNVSQLDETISSLKTQIQQLTASVEAVMDAWKGSKTNAYVSNMEEVYIKEYKNFIDDLNSFKDYLNSIPKIYDSFDSSFSSKNIDV